MRSAWHVGMANKCDRESQGCVAERVAQHGIEGSFNVNRVSSLLTVNLQRTSWDHMERRYQLIGLYLFGRLWVPSDWDGICAVPASRRSISRAVKLLTWARNYKLGFWVIMADCWMAARASRTDIYCLIHRWELTRAKLEKKMQETSKRWTHPLV